MKKQLLNLYLFAAAACAATVPAATTAAEMNNTAIRPFDFAILISIYAGSIAASSPRGTIRSLGEWS